MYRKLLVIWSCSVAVITLDFDWKIPVTVSIHLNLQIYQTLMERRQFESAQDLE